MQIKEWGEIVKIFLNYGAVGCLAILYIYSNTKLFNKIVDNLDSTKKAIDDTVSSLTNIHCNIEDIQNRMNRLDERFQVTTINLLETIYSTRKLSDKEFSQCMLLINGKYLNSAIIQIINEVDENNLDILARLGMLKENTVNIINKEFGNIKHKLIQLNYDVSKIEYISSNYDRMFNSFITMLKSELLNNLTYDDLKDDCNYFVFKSKIKLKIFKFNQELDDKVREINKV